MGITRGSALGEQLTVKGLAKFNGARFPPVSVFFPRGAEPGFFDKLGGEAHGWLDLDEIHHLSRSPPSSAANPSRKRGRKVQGGTISVRTGTGVISLQRNRIWICRAAQFRGPTPQIAFPRRGLAIRTADKENGKGKAK